MQTAVCTSRVTQTDGAKQVNRTKLEFKKIEKYLTQFSEETDVITKNKQVWEPTLKKNNVKSALKFEKMRMILLYKSLVASFYRRRERRQSYYRLLGLDWVNKVQHTSRK